MKLDFGSGYNPQEGYFTCDMTYSPYLDFVFDPIEYRVSAPDNSFDEIFVRNVLHHIPDYGRLFAEFHRILKPEGKVIIIEPNKECYTANTVLDILWYRYVIPRYEVKVFSVFREFTEMSKEYFTLIEEEKIDNFKNKFILKKEKVK